MKKCHWKDNIAVSASLCFQLTPANICFQLDGRCQKIFHKSEFTHNQENVVLGAKHPEHSD